MKKIQFRTNSAKPIKQSTSLVRKILDKQDYQLIGKHGGVKTCHYAKTALHGKTNCYKQKFYGIQSHRCIQMSPAVDACNYNCIFCWRPMEYAPGTPIPINEIDDPKMLVEKSIEAQHTLLIGFKGDPNTDSKKVAESWTPKHAAISLSGEPTLYPRVGEMIEEYHKKGITTFLVTNGSNPEVLEKLIAENRQPTQLYLSLSAPNKELYAKIARPALKNGWERVNKSANMLKKFACRTAIRLTLIKDAMIEPENYAALIKKANPMFVECKGYVHLGFSTYRLERNQMPAHIEIKEFAEKIAKHTGYKIKDEKPESQVVLLTRPDITEAKIDFEKFFRDWH